MNQEKITARQQLALQRIRAVEEWPLYPKLPVKKISFSDVAFQPQTGFITLGLEDERPIPTVKKHGTNEIVAEFNTIEDMVAAGWVED